MKIQKRVNKIPIVLVLATVIVLLAGAGYYFVSASKDRNEAASRSTSDKQSSKGGEQAKKETIDKTAPLDTDAKNAADKGQQSKVDKQNATISITAASQNGSVYQIRTLISAIVSGQCSLALTKGSTTITKTANISAFAQSSTCQGFDIPLTELSTGIWSVKISFEGADITGQTSKEIEIK